MKNILKKVKDVDTYISSNSIDVQNKLKKIRKIIIDTNSDIVESISYGMPAYKLNNRPIAYFAAFDKHIGFYATPNIHKAFAKELANYKQGKGSVQFPLNTPIPFELIGKMVKFNVKEVSN